MSKQSAYFRVTGLSDDHGVKAVKNGLAKIPGVQSVSANLETGRVAVDYDSTGTNARDIAAHIRKLGFEARLEIHEDHTM